MPHNYLLALVSLSMLLNRNKLLLSLGKCMLVLVLALISTQWGLWLTACSCFCGRWCKILRAPQLRQLQWSPSACLILASQFLKLCIALAHDFFLMIGSLVGGNPDPTSSCFTSFQRTLMIRSCIQHIFQDQKQHRITLTSSVRVIADQDTLIGSFQRGQSKS